ncbi:hypothetical protein [Klenkia taihuensis]|uniref:hypothetical protein n=1 Tax=Klenkia taihuensis TaxID=1225127 RepID=UPI000B817ABD|nr:hypothetical protein [Klenkia taihuensis]
MSYTYASYDVSGAQVEAGAFIPEVIETGGTCTLVLNLGEVSAQARSAAVPDASSTSCGALSIPAADLGTGAWDGFISYESATSNGRSDDFVVVIP